MDLLDLIKTFKLCKDLRRFIHNLEGFIVLEKALDNYYESNRF